MKLSNSSLSARPRYGFEAYRSAYLPSSCSISNILISTTPCPPHYPTSSPNVFSYFRTTTLTWMAWMALIMPSTSSLQRLQLYQYSMVGYSFSHSFRPYQCTDPILPRSIECACNHSKHAGLLVIPADIIGSLQANLYVGYRTSSDYLMALTVFSDVGAAVAAAAAADLAQY